jgi:uncharacterized lipoprotein YmbA
MNKRHLLPWPILLVFAALLAACTSKPVNHYLMSPLTGVPAETAHHDDSLGVGPVQLPGYLNRPNLVTRTSPTRIEVPGDHKWGAPLDTHLTATLAENLRQRLGLGSVLVYPWQPGTRLDYQLSADVTRFIYADGAVRLDAGWSLRNRLNGKTIEGSSRIEEDSSDDYDDIVDAMSRALARMADDITLRLQQAAE